MDVFIIVVQVVLHTGEAGMVGTMLTDDSYIGYPIVEVSVGTGEETTASSGGKSSFNKFPLCFQDLAGSMSEFATLNFFL